MPSVIMRTIEETLAIHKAPLNPTHIMTAVIGIRISHRVQMVKSTFKMEDDFFLLSLTKKLSFRILK